MFELLKEIFLFEEKITTRDVIYAVIGCVCLFAIVWTAALVEIAIMGA